MWRWLGLFVREVVWTAEGPGCCGTPGKGLWWYLALFSEVGVGCRRGWMRIEGSVRRRGCDQEALHLGDAAAG